MQHRRLFARTLQPILLVALIATQSAAQDQQTEHPAPDASSISGSQPAQKSPTPVPEFTTTESPAVIKVRTNAVLVRVVVRDQKGNVVENLNKGDFRLFDNKNPQPIATFDVEHPASHNAPAAMDARPDGDAKPANPPATPVVLPERFVALVFDDIHLEMSDAVFARKAAADILDSLAPSDRVAVASTSGEINQDFTTDKNLLRTALSRVSPRPTRGGANHVCPYVSYYQAVQMLQFADPDATALARIDAASCDGQGLTFQSAREAEFRGREETDLAFRRMLEVVKRLAMTPGQRIIAFVSPGLYSETASEKLAEIIDRAVRANIVVDTVDARGLASTGSDVFDFQLAQPAKPGGGVQLPASVIAMRFRAQEQFFVGISLGELADATGGTWFHNRNDLDRGIRQAVAAPPVSYVLGFYPRNLKLDGRYHYLKVTVENAKKLSIEARRGYYAPKSSEDPAKQADEEILRALTSQDEINEFLVEFHTQFFMKDPSDANLSVLAHVNTQTMHFRKEDDRHLDELTIETAVFDQNGRFVTGGKKVIAMRLTDATLERLNRSGLSVKLNFDIKPGSYLIRLVLRDSEGAQMAARNGSVEIPF
jgi:VWFA-related protein